MNLPKQFKHNVREAILKDRENYGGSDAAYAKTLGISGTAFSRIKKGEIDRIISDTNWLSIGRKLEVDLRKKNWKVARTHVYTEIEDNLHECQAKSQSMILVDDCGIGKTFCAKHIVRRMKNAFYVDCSQGKTKITFVRLLARTLGVDDNGKHVEVKENVKMALNVMETPLVVLDEAGDLEYSTMLILKEFWNSAEGNAGWYMMGADGLKAKINKGINNRKVGFAELFSRFSEKFITLSPNGTDDRRKFYTQLIGDVAVANSKGENINKLVSQCYDKLENRHRSLRHLETLIQINA